MNNYYIIEHQLRDDGIINVSETRRGSYASAVSYYHERYSKMVMNEQFPEVALMLVDERLNVLEHTTIQTQYVAKPQVDTEPEPESEVDSEVETEVTTEE